MFSLFGYMEIATMNIFLHVFLGIYVRFFPKLYLLVVEYVNHKVCKF